MSSLLKTVVSVKICEKEYVLGDTLSNFATLQNKFYTQYVGR